VAVNSLHWIDPLLRYTKPASLLRPGGVLAVAGCEWARPADAHPFWTQVQQDYRAAGYPGALPPPLEQLGPRHLPPEAADHFEEVAALRYPFEVGYSARDYLAVLASQSTTRAFGEARAAHFLTLVGGRLESLRWPRLTATFAGYLTIGRRTPGGGLVH
jgi:hypothetical protein